MSNTNKRILGKETNWVQRFILWLSHLFLQGGLQNCCSMWLGLLTAFVAHLELTKILVAHSRRSIHIRENPFAIDSCLFVFPSFRRQNAEVLHFHWSSPCCCCWLILACSAYARNGHSMICESLRLTSELNWWVTLMPRVQSELQWLVILLLTTDSSLGNVTHLGKFESWHSCRCYVLHAPSRMMYHVRPQIALWYGLRSMTKSQRPKLPRS